MTRRYRIRKVRRDWWVIEFWSGIHNDFAVVGRWHTSAEAISRFAKGRT